MSEETTKNTTAEKSETITIRKDALWKYTTVILGVALILVIAFTILPGKSTTGAVVNNGGAQELPENFEKVVLDTDDDAVLGNSNAPVTIIEFTDIQCPFCKRHHDQTFPLINNQYIENGDAKYVIRDFPLTQIHPQALPAANAAECVREQGGDEAYGEFIDTGFENQQTLSESNYLSWASDMGFDIESCVNSGKYNNEISKDLEDGSKAGVTGTPGSFVLMDKNSVDEDDLFALQQPDRRGGWAVRAVESSDGMVGVRISGAFPFEVFKSAIELGL